MNLVPSKRSWGLPTPNATSREGVVLAREIGRPYLEVRCLAQLGFASKTHPFAALAHSELGELLAANQAAERALTLAESDRLVLPFVMTGSRELLEALPQHQTAHAALLADLLDVLHGSSPAAEGQPSPLDVEELSPGELRVLRYLPTNLSRPEMAGELSVSVNTVSTHIRSIYAKLQVRDRSSAVQRARELRLLAAGGVR